MDMDAIRYMTNTTDSLEAQACYQLADAVDELRKWITELETRAIRRLEMVEEAVFSPAPEPETANKVIPTADWNEALNELRDGIASKDFEVAAACMKVALRLLNPCPF
jgi:hypothetical protein